MTHEAITRMKKISKKRGEQITKLLGWRWLYPEIQACHFFGVTLREVYNVGFKTAVYAMNIRLVTGKTT